MSIAGPFPKIHRSNMGPVENINVEGLGRVDILRRNGPKGNVVSFWYDGEHHSVGIPRIYGRVRSTYTTARFSNVRMVGPEWLDESLGAEEPRVYVRVDQPFSIPLLPTLIVSTTILEYDPATRETRKVFSIPRGIKTELPSGLIARVIHKQTRDGVMIPTSLDSHVDVAIPGIVEGMDFKEETGQLCVTSYHPHDENIRTCSYYNPCGEFIKRKTWDESCPY